MDNYIAIINNDVWDDCITIDFDTAPSGTGSKEIIKGHSDYLYYNISTSGTLSYINKTNKMYADTVVLSKANVFNEENIDIVSFDEYGVSSKNVIYSGYNFQPTYIGTNNEDFYYEFSTTSGEAFGIEVQQPHLFDANIHQLYFGERIEFYYKESQVTLQYVNDYIRAGDSFYRVNKVYTIFLSNVDYIKLNDLKNKNILNKIIYIYDNTGKHITEKLIQCVITKLPIVEVFDDMFTITLQINRLVQNG